MHARGGGLAAERREQHLHACRRRRRRPGTGRAARSPADSSPRPIAAATSVARKVPLNESGATSTGRSVMLWSAMAAAKEYTTIEVCGHELRVSSPSKVYFPERRMSRSSTSSEYYLETAEATVRGLHDRPTVLKRWRDGITGEVFFQKRVPEKRPEWLQTATVHFPSGRSATELVPNDAAHLVWGVNLGNIDWNPWPVRRSDLDHPDELRIDLDPQPGVEWSEVREVALCAGDVLREHGMLGFPKTSGSRGIHVNVRIEPRWSFTEVRRAALALAREVERRMPGRATTTVVEGGARRRLPRLQPERARPHRRLAVLGARGARREGVVPAALGRGRRRRARGPAPRHRPRAPARGRRPERDDRRRAPLARRAARPRAPRRGGGPRRRAVAAALRQAGRRAQARAAEPARAED